MRSSWKKGLIGRFLFVTDRQLTDLARLRYNPEQTNALGTLAAAECIIAHCIGAATAPAAGTTKQTNSVCTYCRAGQPNRAGVVRHVAKRPPFLIRRRNVPADPSRWRGQR